MHVELLLNILEHELCKFQLEQHIKRCKHQSFINFGWLLHVQEHLQDMATSDWTLFHKFVRIGDHTNVGDVAIDANVNKKVKQRSKQWCGVKPCTLVDLLWRGWLLACAKRNCLTGQNDFDTRFARSDMWSTRRTLIARFNRWQCRMACETNVKIILWHHKRFVALLVGCGWHAEISCELLWRGFASWTLYT